MIEDRFTIERATRDTVGLAVPLLVTQMKEHGVDLEAMGLADFELAVRGLVENDRGAVLLARERDGSVVGVAVLAHTWTIEHGGRCTWLDELYVVPELRSAGLGTAMLHCAMDLARADGCRAIDLEVDTEHARAERLYVREGFSFLPRRRFSRTLL